MHEFKMLGYTIHNGPQNVFKISSIEINIDDYQSFIFSIRYQQTLEYPSNMLRIPEYKHSEMAPVARGSQCLIFSCSTSGNNSMKTCQDMSFSKRTNK